MSKGIDHAWRNVIANGADDGRLVATSFEESQGAVSVPFPSDLPPALADGLRRAGIESLYAHQNEALGESGQRPCHLDQRYGVGQVALVQPARPREPRARPQVACALPLPHQGARPGPGAKALGAPASLPAPRDLRRRHAARGPSGPPAPLEPDPHQPGHGERRPAAPPPGLGRLHREPALDRRRRGAHLPRRLRLARRERVAAPAPRRAPIPRRAALSPGLGDDRQSRASSPSASSASRSASSAPTARPGRAGGS